MKMHSSPLFNEQGDDAKSSRKMWYGNSTGVVQLNSVKYEWCPQLLNKMLEDFWIPEKINLTNDINDYNDLSPDEKRVYDHVLSYLTYLDSVQQNNLPHIKIPVTAPEVNAVLGFQIYQEELHVKSYQTMIETIIDANRRDEIYQLWRKDAVLKDRCAYIASLYQTYIENPTDENYFVSLLADYLLEGLYFYNGFQIYYNFASQQKMTGSADVFKLINRDEAIHCRIFHKILEEAMLTFPHSKEQIYELTDKAVQQEINWTNHITNGQILGITEASTDQYTKYLANQRLGAIGLDKLYPDDKYKANPYKHLEGIADIGKTGDTKANFFESSVTSYNMSSAIKGWDFTP